MVPLGLKPRLHSACDNDRPRPPGALFWALVTSSHVCDECNDIEQKLLSGRPEIFMLVNHFFRLLLIPASGFLPSVKCSGTVIWGKSYPYSHITDENTEKLELKSSSMIIPLQQFFCTGTISI